MTTLLTLKRLIQTEVNDTLNDDAMLQDIAMAEINMIATIRNELKILETAVREMAIEDGHAEYVETTRTNTPNLAWWKKEKPRTWAKYCTLSPVKKFTWIR